MGTEAGTQLLIMVIITGISSNVDMILGQYFG